MLKLFLTFLRLGCTSFGGPVAHLGYFKDEFVDRKKWLSETEYANIVALCQFIPGPASSQVGAAVGFVRAGYLGAILAWLAFTLPSAILLLLCATSILQLQHPAIFDAFHGLKLVAVAVVAHAVWGMQKQLCSEWKSRTIAIVSAAFILVFSGVLAHLAVIIIAAIVGSLCFKSQPHNDAGELNATSSFRLPRTSAILLGAFLLILLITPFVATRAPDSLIALFDMMYRSGALVFGGGHVVLPLLHNELVGSGIMSEQQFLIGYGAAQAVPGPLFTFATYIGGSLSHVPAWQGALIATIAIFLPGMLLLFAALPIWQALSQHPLARRILSGVNASVVGLLAAILINPLITSTINSGIDIAIVVTAVIGLVRFKLNPLWVIVLCVGSYLTLEWLSLAL